MPTVAYDLHFYQAGIDEMEPYLLSKEIYWPVSASAPAGEPPYPKLTLGAMLLAQQRLEASASQPAQRAGFERAKSQLNALRTRWRSAWGAKAAAEYRARLNLWRDFLSEYRKDRGAHYDRYSYEVGRRVMLHLLEGEADDLPQAQRDLLAALDEMLKAVLQPGAFIWEEQLAAAFPPDAYWYLYGILPES